MWNEPMLHYRGAMTTPGNNQFCEILNTTRACLESYTLGTSVSTGSYRGMFAGGRVSGHVYCTGQDMTLRYYYLRADGTWDTTLDKPDETITASTARPFSWAYSNYGLDLAIVAVAGASAPTLVYGDVCIRWDVASGV